MQRSCGVSAIAGAASIITITIAFFISLSLLSAPLP
jgi:hypothetical protein